MRSPPPVSACGLSGTAPTAQPAPNVHRKGNTPMNAASASPSMPTEQSGSAITAAGPAASAILQPFSERHIAAIVARGLEPELLVKLGVGASSKLPGDCCIGIPFLDGGVRVATKYRTLTGDKQFTQDAG